MFGSGYLFFLYPLLGVALFTGVESWLWRIILLIIVAMSWLMPGLNIAVPAVIILGIAIKNSFSEISKNL